MTGVEELTDTVVTLFINSDVSLEASRCSLNCRLMKMRVMQRRDRNRLRRYEIIYSRCFYIPLDTFLDVWKDVVPTVLK